MPPVRSEITSTTDIGEVSGVGRGRTAEALRRLGIRTAGDLLRHLPARYEHELAEQTVAQVESLVPRSGAADANVALRGEIAAVRVARGRKPRVEATLDDGTGTIRLAWFNMPWLRGKLHPGLPVRVWGRASRYGEILQIVNARWAPIDEGETPPPSREERRRPVYPAGEGVSSETIERAVGVVLEPLLENLEDHLHEDYRRRAGIPPLADALRMIHRPEDPDEAAAARRRLALDELLLLELGVMLKRHHRRRRLKAIALTHNRAIDEHITARFPFELTAAQREVIDEITADLVTEIPMNRLLQGDVGAGKTVVALHAMLLAVASGHQAALMAPTELLADQHMQSIGAMLAGGRVRIELLAGSLKTAERRAVLERLQAGEIDLLVGTHALLTEAVAFKSLAVAVIDEQHRFGVHQRAVLRAKAAEERSSPHVLVMTATPIPRTLSLTIFGDLDVSTIRSLPPGRKPVISRHVARAERDRVYDYVAGRLDGGDQAFVVVPVIDESTSGLTDVESHLAFLRDGPWRGRRLEALHGRLAREEREQIVRAFRDGEIQGLVATTVVEVGVDIPGATIMIIEHAERFGLAQLHQLRGRVGRAGDQGLCVLIADPTTPDGRARIEAFVATNDGFQIAERDLEIRGPGELFGARQSGLPPFRVTELPRDMELLRMARRDAVAWVQENPSLSGPRDALLKRRLLDEYGEALGLGDVA